LHTYSETTFSNFSPNEATTPTAHALIPRINTFAIAPTITSKAARCVAASCCERSELAVPEIAFLITSTGVPGSNSSNPLVAVLMNTVPAIDRAIVGATIWPSAINPVAPAIWSFGTLACAIEYPACE